jgi:hypothetical protein
VLSKILELLDYNKKEKVDRVDKKEKVRSFFSHIPSEDIDYKTKNKLASTYIFNSNDKSNNINEKSVKNILPHKYDAETSKIKFLQFFPWLISFLAVLLLLVNIAYRGKINIKVEILNGNVIGSAPDVSNDVSLKKDFLSEVKSANGSDMPITSTPFFTEGRPNSDIIKKLGFYGAALSKSGVTRDGIFLFNDGTTGWASAGLDLVEPMDLSSSSLDFVAKGVYGNESLKLFLRDAENKSYMPQAYNLIFNKNLGRDWQFVSIPFDSFSGVYNPKKIKHIGFEFGIQTTSNESGASIYIKNIKIVKNSIATSEK